MFYSASSANPDTSNWDVSSVTNMGNMFRFASSANPDTTNWDVSSVTSMYAMFLNASSANPDVSNWNVSNVVNMYRMFVNSNLSVENLTAIYENWSQLNLQQNVSFSAGNTKYNASGQAGRDILVNTYNWTITDGGVTSVPFIIEVNTANTGVSNNNQFQFTGAEGDYDVVAKQNDIVVATFNDLSGAETITLPSAGIYDLEVFPKASNGFNRIKFDNDGDRKKVINLKQWGNIVWSDFKFRGCFNMYYNATDSPDLTQVGALTVAFYNCINANIDARNWDVSGISGLSAAFNNTGMSKENLTAIYENWSQLSLQQNVDIDFGDTQYFGSGQAGKDILVNTYNWTITDGGQV